MNLDDITTFTYPWLADVRKALPKGAMFGMLPGAAQLFMLAQALERSKTERNPRIVPISEIVDFETGLVRIQAVSNVDNGELGLMMAKLIPAHFEYPPAACAWLYQELLCGKPWSLVRDSDPHHPAPMPEWSRNFEVLAARFHDALARPASATPRRRA